MKITISDIAKMANVSKGTVSRVLNDSPDGVSPATRHKIQEIIKSVGYKPNMVARSLVTSKSKDIAVILPDISNPFFPAIVRGVEDLAIKSGYSIFVCNSDGSSEKESEYILTCIEKRAAGIILISSYGNKPGLDKVKREELPPIIIVDRGIEDTEAITIQNDNIYGGYVATKNLIESGCKKIVYLGGTEGVDISKKRIEGYKKALKEYGIKYEEKMVYQKNFSVKAAFEMVDELLKSGIEFDGIFCACDMIAIGAIKQLKKSGIMVPDDVLVCGFDNIFMSGLFEPEITTVDQMPYLMGEIAINVMIKLINNNYNGERKIVLTPNLIKRKSTRRRDTYAAE